MTQTMPQIARDRAAHLLNAFHNAALPPKMALGSPQIRQNMTLLWQGTWEDDRPGKSFFFIHPSNPTLSSVWAIPSYTGYGGAYKRFITRAYGIAHPTVPSGLDVDHLQAKETVPAGSVIRLEAVAFSSNRSHGGGVEKRMGDSTVTDGRKAANHTPGSMTWFVALKLAGVLSPTVANSASAEARMQAAVDYFTSNGWDAATVQAGLEGLTEVIDRR